MAGPDRKILILGGTGEGRLLAGLLHVEKNLKVITSLAGRTSAPELPAGEWRSGGFGGAEGLATYLMAEAISLVADATHPFAATMSRNAAEACRQVGIAYVRLERPAWRRARGDRWRPVESVAAAAAAIPARARALVTVGQRDIAAFFARADTRILARMIEPPQIPLPPHVDLLLARPPFSLDAELALFREHGTNVLVCRNSGGDATKAKLAATRELHLPVIMIERPEKPAAPSAATPEGLRSLILELA
ncbi:MAG: cobalt-precorrin-6A reductase [Hyphomicrobiales bacterium]|nr:cobalt-precorrin-6A reductase [Hyphomicrobiales bacterium]